ncbi:MAG TPA: hypothetical protein VMS40_11880 [Vicinamibacterales bacterium]|nr:hypothetical protein [Vicinamibacterales bacterium]
MRVATPETVGLPIDPNNSGVASVRREEVQERPQIVALGSVARMTGKGRQYEDGRKYDERQ